MPRVLSTSLSIFALMAVLAAGHAEQYHPRSDQPTDAIGSGAAKLGGSQAKLEEVVSYLDTFEFWFNIVTP